MRRLLPFALLAAVAAPVQADELDIVGRHAGQGRDAAGDYALTLTIAEDATFQATRRYADGQETTRRGQVRVVAQALELRVPDEAPRRFERDDTERQVRWTWREGSERETFVQERPKEGRMAVLARLLQRREGASRWLLEGNLGQVDPDPERLILRCRQPTPSDVVRYQERYGVKTIISLNGDQDEPTRYAPRGGPERKVALHDFIVERGIRHETFKLSASRAPSDDELRAVFRLLRDDANKPILIHCRGGSDRTGVVSALYAIEYLGQSKAEAKQTMRSHMWAADGGTEIQGAVVDLYQPGHLRRLLGEPVGAWY